MDGMCAALRLLGALGLCGLAACGRTPIGGDLDYGGGAAGEREGDARTRSEQALDEQDKRPTAPTPVEVEPGRPRGPRPIRELTPPGQLPPPPPPPPSSRRAPPDAAPRCGDGIVQTGELCDGDRFLNVDRCDQVGLGLGKLGCSERCRIDTSACQFRRPRPPRNQPRVRACLATARANAPNLACADELCQCDLQAAAACGARCWDTLVCLSETCGNPDADSCTPEACYNGTFVDIGDLLPCLLRTRETCGLFGELEPRSFCGNEVAEGDEMCDGGDLNGLDCADLDLTGSGLRCDARCRLDFAACGTTLDSCGDGSRDPGEQCDGNDLGGRTCESFGLAGDGLACNDGCILDARGCVEAVCGNGHREAGEDCDGEEIPGGCADQGFTGGALGCSASCTFDVSRCTECGNGRVEEGEVCDAANVSGQTCRSLGFSGGTLACSDACAFDISSCSRCGNEALEPGEVCDGMDLSGASCMSLGLAGGVLACDPNSCRYDTSGCEMSTQLCGNNVAEAAEECDGMDLAGLDCSALGFDIGALACNPDTCRYDSSDCRFEVPEPEASCMMCGQERCQEAIESCVDDGTCIEGMACLAERCGPNANIDCAVRCFNPDAALLAIGMFSCIVSECGQSCIGEY